MGESISNGRNIRYRRAKNGVHINTDIRIWCRAGWSVRMIRTWRFSFGMQDLFLIFSMTHWAKMLNWHDHPAWQNIIMRSLFVQDFEWKARQYQALGPTESREGFLAPNLVTLSVAVGFNKTTCLIAEKSLSHWRVPNSILRSTAEYTFLVVCQPCDPAMYVTSFNNVSLPSFSMALTISPVIIERFRNPTITDTITVSEQPYVTSSLSVFVNANSVESCFEKRVQLVQFLGELLEFKLN